MSRNRNSNFNSARRQPRTPTYRSDWRSKLDPLFLRLAGFHKKTAQFRSGRLPKTAIPKFVREERELTRVVKQRRKRNGQGNPQFLSSLLGVENRPEISLDELMLRRICWYKYHTTPEELLRRRNSRDFGAARKLNQLLWDCEKWAFGKWDAAPESFKPNVDHYLLIAGGLHFGLNKLTETELAEFFVGYCPCGKSEHDGESLRKLRNEIQRHATEAKPASGAQAGTLSRALSTVGS